MCQENPLNTMNAGLPTAIVLSHLAFQALKGEFWIDEPELFGRMEELGVR